MACSYFINKKSQSVSLENMFKLSYFILYNRNIGIVIRFSYSGLLLKRIAQNIDTRYMHAYTHV